MIKRSKVEATVNSLPGDTWFPAVRLGQGSYHNLDEVLGQDAAGNDVVLRDVVDEAWFEDSEEEEKL